MKGRKPLPRNLKLIKGTLQNCLEPDPESQVHVPDPGDINPPSSLGEIAKTVWLETAPILKEAGILKVTDLYSLESYCQCFEVAQKAYFKTQDDDDGAHVRTWKAATSELRYWSSLLGLDPSSRGRLAVDGKRKDENPFNDF